MVFDICVLGLYKCSTQFLILIIKTHLIMKKLRHFTKSEQMEPRTYQDKVIDKELLKKIDKQFIQAIPKPSNPKLVNSANGKISWVLLTLPEYAFNEDALIKVYADLLLKLPTYTEFLILTHEHIYESVVDWLKKLNDFENIERVKIERVDKHLHFSVWAEDAHAITYDNNNIFFAQPFEFPRYADSILSKISANVSDSVIYQAPLYFQGGNILIGDDFFFIGKDYANNSLNYIGKVIQPETGKDNEQLIKELYGEYLDKNKELYYIGSTLPVPRQEKIPIKIDNEDWTQTVYFGNKSGTLQPLFHIDMFISLVGRKDEKYQIMVGDPKMAADLLKFPECLEFAMADVFDNIAEQLSKIKDFEIIRNPLPLVYLDDPENKERIWYFATSNNCLIENTGDEKNVWLPTYGHGSWKELSTTDSENKKIWKSLGYVVHSLEDFHPFAENLGAVHCIKKYLKR